MKNRKLGFSFPVLLACGLLSLNIGFSADHKKEKAEKIEAKAEKATAKAEAQKAEPQVEQKDLEVATTPQEIVEEEVLDIQKISEAFGHVISKNIGNIEFQFDMHKVVQGLNDAINGKESPMLDNDCIHAITREQEKRYKMLAEKNLKDAQDFLVSNAEKAGVTCLENNKLQYKIEAEGSGEVVQAHYSPLIKYTGKFLDGSIFGASQEHEMISLDETIPGFSKGIIGMKEGEKRTLFIHPELAYGTQPGPHLPPNSLLMFEIEVVKANHPQDQDPLASMDLEEEGEIAAEIAESQVEPR